MSYTAAGAGELANEPVRRVYYLHTTSSDETFYVNDQVPDRAPMRVQAAAAMGVTNTTTLINAVERILELRLYNAFSAERCYSNVAESGSFIILGHFTAQTSAAANIASYNFVPTQPIECRVMGGGPWRVVVWNPVSTPAAPASVITIASVSIALDVRRGGKLEYVN